MRAVQLARLDKTRPVLVLTRPTSSGHYVTVAPITSTIVGLSSEVRLDHRNGIDHESIASCDNIRTIARSDLGRHLGVLLPEQEHGLTAAIHAAFDLR
ncbi:MAG: type II toxin-antitoxin system PemK/MazF family toxin [Sporichthyaceae bacterium]